MRRFTQEQSIELHTQRIRDAVELRDSAERRITVAVNDALAAGFSYEDAAKLLGISRATLHRRYVQTQQTLRLGR